MRTRNPKNHWIIANNSQDKKTKTKIVYDARPAKTVIKRPIKNVKEPTRKFKSRKGHLKLETRTEQHRAGRRKSN